MSSSAPPSQLQQPVSSPPSEFASLAFSRTLWTTLIFTSLLIYFIHRLGLNWSLFATGVLTLFFVIAQLYNHNIDASNSKLWPIFQLIMGIVVIVWYVAFAMLNKIDSTSPVDAIDVVGSKPVDVASIIGIIVGGIIVIIVTFSNFSKNSYKDEKTSGAEKAKMDDFNSEAWTSFFNELDKKPDSPKGIFETIKRMLAKLSQYNGSLMMVLLLTWVSTIAAYYYTSEAVDTAIVNNLPPDLIRHFNTIMMVFFGGAALILLLGTMSFLPFMKALDPNIKNSFMNFIDSIQNWQWKGIIPGFNDIKEKFKDDNIALKIVRFIMSLIWMIIWFALTLFKSFLAWISFLAGGAVYALLLGLYRGLQSAGMTGPRIDFIKSKVDAMWRTIYDYAMSLIPFIGKQYKFTEDDVGMYIFKNPADVEPPPTNVQGQKVSFIKKMLNFVGIFGMLLLGACLMTFVVLQVISKGYTNTLVNVLAGMGIVVALAMAIASYRTRNAASDFERGLFEQIDSPGAPSDGIFMTFMKLVWGAIKYIPCLLLAAVESLREQLNITTRPIWILLFIEILIVAAIFGAPYLVNAVVSSGSKAIISDVDDLSIKKQVSSLDESGVFIYHNTADNRSKSDADADCPPEQKKRYMYSTSGWFYLHSPGVGQTADTYLNILDVGGVPKMAYNSATNNLRFTMKVEKRDGSGNVVVTDKVMYETNPIPAKKVQSVDAQGNPRIIDASGNTGIINKQQTIISDNPEKPVNTSKYEYITNVDEEILSKIINIPTQIQLQKWTNFIINYDGNNFDIFINGELVSSNKNVIPVITNNAIISGEENGLKGNICNVQFFDHVLTGDNVRWMYNAYKTLNPPVIQKVKTVSDEGGVASMFGVDTSGRI